MLRNVELLFKGDCTENCSKSRGGDLAVFLQRLEQEIANRDECLEITLIGQSMGTIVANRILRSVNIKFRNIVYMAAACSVEDYEQSVFPYLEKNLPMSRMYHLVLDDITEARETSASILFARGSLLVWIDNFLSSPLTLRQRTAGRFVNLVRVLDDTPLELHGMVHVKALGRGRTDPQRHGDFLKMRPGTVAVPMHPFYKEDFWMPETKEDHCCRHRNDDADCK